MQLLSILIAKPVGAKVSHLKASDFSHTMMGLDFEKNYYAKMKKKCARPAPLYSVSWRKANMPITDDNSCDEFKNGNSVRQSSSIREHAIDYKVVLYTHMTFYRAALREPTRRA